MRFPRFRRRTDAKNADQGLGEGAEQQTSERSAVNELVPEVAHADRYTFQDLVADATADIGSRPGRLVMTLLGTVLGIGSLVATIGFSQTAAAQIASEFDVAQSTYAIAAPVESQAGTRTVAAGRLPWDGPSRVERLAGVESATALADIKDEDRTITAVPVNDPSAPEQVPPTLATASSEFITTLRGTVTTGRSYDRGHEKRGDRVAMLGKNAAQQLGINRLETQPSIFINGIAYAVIGIFDGLERRGDLLDAVVVPPSAAREDFDVKAPTELHIQIAIGAGEQVKAQAPLVLDPVKPESLEVSAPSGKSDLKEQVGSQVDLVFLIVGIVALLAGGLGIANVTLLNVMERVGEIGLRRALGATRRQIASQFMLESIVIGLLGGLIGSSLAVLAVVVISITQQWTPVVDSSAAIGGAVLGAVVGWVAGWYPARRASNIEPVEALRGS